MVRNDPLRAISTRATPQSQRADPRQSRNSAGGHSFTVTSLERLRRFLTLGTTGGTYYVSQGDLTRANADAILDLVRSDGQVVVNEIVVVSEAGRAPRNQPALFALAVAISHGDVETRRAAAEALPRVARTGTHLMQFVAYAKQFRGWGRVYDRAIEGWYLNQEVGKLAYQTVKYRQREGWTHRDLLRLAKPRANRDDLVRRSLFHWITHRDEWSELVRHSPQPHDELRILEGFEAAQRATTAAQWATLVADYRLSWETLPTDALNQRAVWEALLELGLPQTALLRQLPRLTNLGLLPTTGGWTRRVAAQLSDRDRMTRGRVHPINVLIAQRTYAQGRGERGGQTWTPTRAIVDALDAAFYAAYGAVTPTGKRLRLALDVSGSMGASVGGLPITCREASAALALVTANVEAEYDVVGFTSGNRSVNWRDDAALTPLAISPRQRLDDATRSIANLPFGGTDCALPMLDALKNRRQFDAFVIYTDSETWAGRVHPHQALRQYREQMGINARLIVVGMTSTGFTIADPSDPGMLDVAGFDASVPNVISDFAVGAV